MFERFSQDVRRAVLAAAEEASRRRGDPRLGTEHLLVGVAATDDPLFEALGISAEAVRRALDDLDTRALRAIGVDVGNDLLSPEVTSRWRRCKRGHVPFTHGARNALHRSLQICLAEGHRVIGAAHLLAALAVGRPEDPAVRTLHHLGIHPADVESYNRRSWQT